MAFKTNYEPKDYRIEILVKTEKIKMMIEENILNLTSSENIRFYSFKLKL